MNCREYQFLISAQVDGDVSAAEVVEAERHQASCEQCAGVYRDLRTLVSEAQALPLFEPDQRVWTRLKAQCEADGLIHTAPSPWRSWLDRIPIPSGPRLAMASAALVVVVMLASFLAYRGLQTTSTRQSAEAIQAENEVRRAEDSYLQAIESLEKISQARMASMDPAVRGVLEDNLATIDYYIDKCLETVKNEPSDALAQRYLLEAYRKKVDLLTSIVHSNVL
jgi:anti-sigma factor RsiW